MTSIRKDEALETCHTCPKLLQRGCLYGDIEGHRGEYIDNPPECLVIQLQGSSSRPKTSMSKVVSSKNHDASCGVKGSSMGGAIENHDASCGVRGHNMGRDTPPHIPHDTPPVISGGQKESKDWNELIISAIENKCNQNEICRRMKRFGLSDHATRNRLKKLEEKGEITFEWLLNDINRGVGNRNKDGVRLKTYFLTAKGKEVHIYHNRLPLDSVSKIMGDNEVPELQHGVQYCADIIKRPEKEPIAEHYWNPNNWARPGMRFSDPSGENKFKLRILPQKMIIDYSRKFVNGFPPSTEQDAKFEQLAKDFMGKFCEDNGYQVANIRKNRVPDRKVPNSEELADQFDGTQTDEKTNSTTDASDVDKDNPRHIEFHGKTINGDVKAADQKAKANYSKFMRAMDGLENLKTDLRTYHDDLEIATAHLLRDAMLGMHEEIKTVVHEQGNENMKLLIAAITSPHIIKEILKKQVEDEVKEQVKEQIKGIQQPGEPDRKMYG